MRHRKEWCYVVVLQGHRVLRVAEYGSMFYAILNLDPFGSPALEPLWRVEP